MRGFLDMIGSRVFAQNAKVPIGTDLRENSSKKEKTMRKLLLIGAAIAGLSVSTAKADDLALIPVGMAASAAVIEVAASGVLTPAVAVMLPIVGFTYLAFETDYKPYEALFGKDRVFYEYPKM